MPGGRVELGAVSYTTLNRIRIWNYLVVDVDIWSMIKIFDVGKIR
jgi:hypothetical protein